MRGEEFKVIGVKVKITDVYLSRVSRDIKLEICLEKGTFLNFIYYSNRKTVPSTGNILHHFYP